MTIIGYFGQIIRKHLSINFKDIANVQIGFCRSVKFCTILFQKYWDVKGELFLFRKSLFLNQCRRKNFRYPEVTETLPLGASRVLSCFRIN